MAFAIAPWPSAVASAKCALCQGEGSGVRERARADRGRPDLPARRAGLRAGTERGGVRIGEGVRRQARRVGSEADCWCRRELPAPKAALLLPDATLFAPTAVAMTPFAAAENPIAVASICPAGRRAGLGIGPDRRGVGVGECDAV